jgi:hypothetical protein
MTDVISGAGGLRQSSSRFASFHRVFGTLLGGSSPPEGLTIGADRKTISLQMRDVPVVDQPRWPALDSIATPARMTFKMVWKSTGEPVQYENPAQQFLFIGTRAECHLEASVTVPSIGFSWNPIRSKHPPRASQSSARKSMAAIIRRDNLKPWVSAARGRRRVRRRSSPQAYEYGSL